MAIFLQCSSGKCYFSPVNPKTLCRRHKGIIEIKKCLPCHSLNRPKAKSGKAPGSVAALGSSAALNNLLSGINAPPWFFYLLFFSWFFCLCSCISLETVPAAGCHQLQLFGQPSELCRRWAGSDAAASQRARLYELGQSTNSLHLVCARVAWHGRELAKLCHAPHFCYCDQIFLKPLLEKRNKTIEELGWHIRKVSRVFQTW